LEERFGDTQKIKRM